MNAFLRGFIKQAIARGLTHEQAVNVVRHTFMDDMDTDPKEYLTPATPDGVPALGKLPRPLPVKKMVKQRVYEQSIGDTGLPAKNIDQYVTYIDRVALDKKPPKSHRA